MPSRCLTLSLLALLVSLFGPGAAADTVAPQPDIAALIAQADAAARAGDKQALEHDDARISAVHAALPAWVGKSLAAARAYGASDAAAVRAIREMHRQAIVDVAKGDLQDAISDQQTAVFDAGETFGPNHWFTIAATRDLGHVYRLAGDLGQSEKNYRTAYAAAVRRLGARHPRTLEIAALLAEDYAATGRYDKAVALRQTVADGLTRSLGADHVYTIEARMALVRSLETVARFHAAMRQTLDLCVDVARTWGQYHPQYIRCQALLGNLQGTTGRLTDAAHTYRQVSTLMGKVFPAVNSEVLDNLSQLAQIYRRQGNYRDSKRLLSGVIQLSLQSGRVDQSNLAKADLGRVFTDEGDYVKAQKVTEEALKYGKGHWQDTPLQFYNTLLELGHIYQARGKLPDAEATFEQAYKGLHRLFGDDNRSTLVAMNDLGQCYEKIGLYDKAEPLLKQALAKLAEDFGPAHPATLRARNNLALMYENQGDFREAEPLYLTSLALMRQVHGDSDADTIAAENNLAYLYLLEQRYTQSVDLFKQVRTGWTRLVGADHQDALTATSNLARVYERMGQYGQAEPLFEQALAARERVFGPDHMDTIRAMIDLGGLYMHEGRLTRAHALLTDALTRAELVLGKEHPYTFDALDLLSRTDEKLGDLQAAVKLAETGMKRRSDFLNRVLWTTGENSREGYLRLVQPELDRYLTLIAQLDPADAGKKELEVSLERKGLLLRVTSQLDQVSVLGKNPALKQAAQQLQIVHRKLASLTLSGPTQATPGHRVAAMHALEQRLNDLQRQLGRASARYRDSVAGVSLARLEQALPGHTALVDFTIYDQHGQQKMLAGIAIKNAGKVKFDLVKYADMESINDAILNYRKMIQDDMADDREIRDAGRRANDLIWAPIAHVLQGTKVVYLVPDGMLNILPFDALVTRSGKYLVQTNDVRILTSARDLLPSDLKSARGRYLVLAGPNYNAEGGAEEKQPAVPTTRRVTYLQLGILAAGSGLRGLRFSPLPGARREGRLVTKLVEESGKPGAGYFGVHAREAVLSDLEQPPAILHLATHGFFLEESDNLHKRLLKEQRGIDEFVPPPGDNPLLRAGLAFAGANGNAPHLGDINTRNDGVLTAMEVPDLDLSGTRLVVLSACETGPGEIDDGEGVYRLRRAFQEAGVAQVVSSLWEVSDAGTRALMAAFYKRLLAGETPRAALRNTELSMIDSPRWGYPYIWSAFMIVGSDESAGFRRQGD